MSLVENIEGKKINIKYVNKQIPIEDNMKIEIEKYWKEVSNIFRRGKIFAVNNIEENDKELNIETYYSDYAHYIYTRRHKLEENKKCNNLWAGILLETIDNKYIFGEMSEVTATSGEYHISGGSCDEADIENNKMNYEKTMFRELKEEFNIDKKELKNVKLKYLKLPSEKEADIGILYKGIVDKTSNEFKKDYEDYLRFLKETNGEIEFKKLVFVNKNIEDVKKFVNENKNILMEFTEDMLLDDLNN